MSLGKDVLARSHVPRYCLPAAPFDLFVGYEASDFSSLGFRMRCLELLICWPHFKVLANVQAL